MNNDITIDPALKRKVFKIGKWKFGYMDQIIGREQCPYLRRKILFLGLWSIRYHIFYRSDEERALHDHPWAFITIPINRYGEFYLDKNREQQFRVTKRFIPQFRKHGFTHRVVTVSDSKVRTLIFTFRVKSSWGFLLGGKIMHWKEWLVMFGLPPCADYEEIKKPRP